ncbi:glycosyltransferase family 2 protein [Arcicella sp. LKC2W]|uniref:glycosyltransferase family 2 protein n=1 Tax=Arcicella sp. LKC2W TaxID=2984198 RepID=UPI002B1EFD97|nr:glycosyltransferase family 2 protein [Arcicella sp. LKC2W]MEA5459899.1 glycosyltransferase family 2 protein [Arcicella sp. LKC2W]
MQTISIALCTYNGSRFLREQLQSLANQTLLPTEVIITDDCSTDNTSEIIKEFENVLNIKFFKNDTSLKVTKNFERAISICSGDIILMCDQDDLWHADKLAKIHQYFQNNTDKVAVFSDAELVDEKGESLGNNFWSVVRFHEWQRQQWKNGQEIEILLAGNRSAGCMMGFRKELIEKIIPFPMHIPEMIHDNWITIMAAMLDKIGIIEERLISYRQHSFQQIGTRPKESGKAISLKDRFSRPRAEKLAPFLAKSDYFCTLKKALTERIDENNPNFKQLDRIINFFEVRGSLSPFHLARLFPVLKLLLSGDYHLYKDQEASWKAPFVAAIGDLLE